MLKKICDITAMAGLSDAPSRKLFKVISGEYAGRVLAIVRTTSQELAFSFADAPYKLWSTLTVIASDAADLPYDAAMTENGDVHLVYIEQSTFYAIARKLEFTVGDWTVGDPVYIYNGNVCHSPSVTADASGRLWVSWSQLASGYYDLRVKTSDDGGATWGSGPADPGEALKTGLSDCRSRTVVSATHVFVVFTANGNAISVIYKPLTTGEWSSEQTVATGSTIDEHFDAATSENGMLGVVFDDAVLFYREFDGNNWTSLLTLDASGGEFPQIRFNGNTPLVTYTSELGSGQWLLRYTYRKSGSFSSPQSLEPRTGYLDSVLLYDSISASYADVTEAAASAEAADVFHPATTTLIKAASDAVYLGMDRPFRFARILLSTPGDSGTVIYSYFNGADWAGFAPINGNFNFDSGDKSILLWEDIADIPSDWQKCAINNQSRYWVKIEVISAFVTGPVGNQITAATNTGAFTCRR